MEKRDFIFSLFLLALGVGVVVESLRMPRMENFGYGPYAAPGLMPGLVGAAIALCAISLFIRTIRESQKISESTGSTAQETPTETALDATKTETQIKALAATLILVIAYALGLVGTIPFWLATFLFMFAFILYFEWSETTTRKARIRTITTAFAQAAATAIGVTLLFEKIFKVNLPG